MEAYKNIDESIKKNINITDVYNKTRSWITASIGIIITVLCAVAIFIISSIEGTKEIKASSSVSGKILTEWRLENGVEVGFPEEKVDIMNYNGKEYYFVIEERDPETKEITKWYWAFDGGLGYVFKDYKYYVMTFISLVLSMFVASVNFTSTIRSLTKTNEFAKTLIYYQQQKDKAKPYTQYLSLFCIDKNKEAYDIAKRDIIEDAGLKYEDYVNDNYDFEKLMRWQKRKLWKIRKIKIDKLHSSDLLQEKAQTTTKIQMLTISQSKFQTKFLTSKFFKSVLNSAVGGLTFAFGLVIENWTVGLVYSLMIFMSWVSAVMTATDYVETKLKARYIGKADYLIEFDNIKDKYIMANMKADPIAVKESLTELEQEKPLLKNINGVYRLADVGLKI
jgi:hypothetical protein